MPKGSALRRAAPVTKLSSYSKEWNDELHRILGDELCTHLGVYHLPSDLLVSIVVPVFNEKQSIKEIIPRIAELPFDKEIIVVDDGSKDGTREFLQQLETQKPLNERTSLRVLYREKNGGKGAALRTGFAESRGKIIVIQDADLEYEPHEIPRLLQPIIEKKADVVFGSRFLGDQQRRVLYFWHSLANRGLTFLSNMLNNINLSDMESGYKVFTRDVLQDVLPTLKQNRFGFEPEFTAKVARRGFSIYEIAISYSGRTYEEGKKIGWKDGVSALWCLIRYAIAD